MKLETKIWLNVIIGMLLISLIGWMVWKLPCPSSNQYIYIRVVLALSVGCLSALLMGFIQINNKAIKAGGACAIFLIVLKFTPDLINTENKCGVSAFRLQIYFRDEQGGTIRKLNGMVSILIQNSFYQESRIDDKGRVVFENIPANFSVAGSNKAQIELKQVDGFWYADIHKKVFDTLITSDNMTLKLSPDESDCCVSGYIRDERTNNGLDSVQVTLTDNNQDTVTGKNGYYLLNIPQELRGQALVVELKRRKYITKLEQLNSKLSKKDIFLTPQQ